MRQNGQNHADVLFIKELFDIDDIVVDKITDTNYDIYMTGSLVLWMFFDGNKIKIARPNNMSVNKEFVVNDKNIDKIRKCIEKLWIENYANLARDDQDTDQNP
ncbi:MAG: hypothetical protein GF411_08705 [Candidatus Lokiarchaeota archaeon]|nr:hypothetical protein [Candidatus Lokiarchaeota archaeon]